MRRGPIKCSESFEPVPVQPFAARTFLLLNAAYRVFSFYISMSTGRGFVVVNKCLIGSPRRAPADGFLELSALASSARGYWVAPHGKSDLIALDKEKQRVLLHAWALL
jgi:hypothetical protein